MEFFRHFSEISRHRALVGALTSRDLKARYRGSVLGFLWTFLNPLLLLLVYSLVFSVYFRVQMENYAVFMFTGLLPWVFFSQALNEATGAITDAGSLVTKVMFPMQVLVSVRVWTNFINFLLSLPILALFYLGFGKPVTWTALALPLVALVQLWFTYSLSLLLATACVFMRDTRHILNNVLTLWFFVTPILYPPAQVPAAFQPLVKLNPAALLAMAYHDALFWGRWPNAKHLAAVAFLSLIFTWAGVKIFDTYKEYFAEKI
ncbi:MAG: ABC transporter permease [Deltaproteobacteria bacterium]|nr:ABC transporter permease [Deltaproteobacteria bacterium]